GSFALEAFAPPGFGLQTRRTISFVSSGTVVEPGNVGSPCASTGSTGGGCNTSLFCSFNDTCFSGASTCRSKGGTGACCTADEECVTTCDSNTGTCAASAGSVPAGGSCTQGSDCVSGFCSG